MADKKNSFDEKKIERIIEKGVKLSNNTKYLITIPGSELARGGGGARCMTMPIKRNPGAW